MSERVSSMPTSGMNAPTDRQLIVQAFYVLCAATVFVIVMNLSTLFTEVRARPTLKTYSLYLRPFLSPGLQHVPITLPLGHALLYPAAVLTVLGELACPSCAGETL